MELAELMQRSENDTLNRLRVGIPAQIESYNPTNSTATVILSIHQPQADDDLREFAPITDVPVMWMRAGDVSITYPLKRGDWGYCMFADYDISNWVSELSKDPPTSLRQHAFTDAVFLPQSHNLGASSLSGLQLKNGASSITINSGRIDIVSTIVSINGIVFDTHKHTGVQTGGGVTGNPING
jgi:hypothetical protein